jgi:hypothetical protein
MMLWDNMDLTSWDIHPRFDNALHGYDDNGDNNSVSNFDEDIDAEDDIVGEDNDDDNIDEDSANNQNNDDIDDSSDV